MSPHHHLAVDGTIRRQRTKTNEEKYGPDTAKLLQDAEIAKRSSAAVGSMDGSYEFVPVVATEYGRFGPATDAMLSDLASASAARVDEHHRLPLGVSASRYKDLKVERWRNTLSVAIARVSSQLITSCAAAAAPTMAWPADAPAAAAAAAS